MKKLKKGLLSFAITLISFTAYSQSGRDLRLNEIFTNPDSISANLTNEWGIRSGWFEIFNPSYKTIDIGGCYVTDDVNNPKKYRFPQGDAGTQIAPLQYLLIWTDGTASHGPLYTNFELNPNGGYLALYSNDGRSLIDKVEYPALAENTCYAIGENAEWVVSSELTPRLENFPSDEMSAPEKIKLHDPRGVIMTIITMSTVFILLIVLYICFKQLAKFFVKSSKKKAAAAHGVDIDNTKIQHVGEDTGDVYAAIALAIRLYQDDIHDVEDMVITIEREDKVYSPWSSKVHTLRQIPTVIKNK